MKFQQQATVAPQALYMMNSPFISEQAEHFARRVLADEGMTDGQRLDLAWKLALCRSPLPEEAARVSEFIDSATSPALDVWTRVCHILLASSEFRYVN